jgi:hypothetical protein
MGLTKGKGEYFLIDMTGPIEGRFMNRPSYSKFTSLLSL